MREKEREWDKTGVRDNGENWRGRGKRKRRMKIELEGVIGEGD